MRPMGADTVGRSIGEHGDGDSLHFMPGDDRKYEPDEVGLVLRRVAELQAHEPPATALTRTELEQVVTESGLDVRHLDAALAELETHDKNGARSLGLRLFVVLQRSIPGELSLAKLEAAAALLDRSLGVIGDRAIRENTLTWFGRHVAVSIRMEGSRISIQIEERFRQTVQSRLGISLVSAVPAGALLTAITGPAAPLLVLVPIGLYTVFRYGHRRRIEATERQFQRLAEQLVAALT
jgi:hypothetical protein